jgi:hypothetical protein
MEQYKRYPLNLTKFKTNNYIPKNHFRIPLRWDNFTMHVPLWNQVLSHFFKDKKDFKVLELGTGNGLCANFLLDNYSCRVETVDLYDSHIVDEEVSKIKKKYIVSTINNLQPFIDNGKCKFYQMSTKEFLFKNQNKKYDFIYIDASHDKDWVLFDSVNSFSLLKKDGLMIFDDYGWGECSVAIDAFLNCYKERVEVFYKQWQVMIRKLSCLKTQSEINKLGR